MGKTLLVNRAAEQHLKGININIFDAIEKLYVKQSPLNRHQQPCSDIRARERNGYSTPAA